METQKQTAKETKVMSLVKIQAIRSIAPESLKPKIFNPGQMVEVTEEEAKMFCDMPFDGYAGESGERSMPFNKETIYRAKRM